MPKGIKQRERLGCNARLSAEFIQEQMLLGIRADVLRQLCMHYLGIRWLWGRGEPRRETKGNQKGTNNVSTCPEIHRAGELMDSISVNPHSNSTSQS